MTCLRTSLAVVTFLAVVGVAFPAEGAKRGHAKNSGSSFALSMKKSPSLRWNGQVAYAAAHAKWDAPMSRLLEDRWAQVTGGESE